jgi:hypothetical protein
LGKIQATARFQIIGMTGPGITAAQPIPADLNLETYAEMSNAFDQLVQLRDTNKVTLVPQVFALLPDSPSQDSDYQVAVARTWALRAMVGGNTRGQAVSKFVPTSNPKSPNTLLQSAIEEVYKRVAGITDDTTPVSPSAKSKASGLMAGVRVDPRAAEG